MLRMAPALGAAGQLPPCPKSVWRKHAPERNALYLIGRRLGLDVGLLMSNASVSRVRLGSTGPLITVRSDPRDKKTGTLVRREMGRDTYGLLNDEQNGQSESQMIDIGGHVGMYSFDDFTVSNEELVTPPPPAPARPPSPPALPPNILMYLGLEGGDPHAVKQNAWPEGSMQVGVCICVCAGGRGPCGCMYMCMC